MIRSIDNIGEPPTRAVPTTVEVVREAGDDSTPEIVYYKIHNPMAKRHWREILAQLHGQLESEIERWRDATFKKILPPWAYKSAHSGKREEAKKVWDYMLRERIEIVHPDGHSLERFIRVKGKTVSLFRIELFSQ